MRINTNMAALNAWRNMTTNEGNVQKSLEKLSSGFRINRAADDAAGLAVSEKMRAQIRGTNMAVRNSQDGISLVQTAEGALTETHSILQRMRELAVEGSTSTLSADDNAQVQTEFDQLRQEIDRIASNTKFNTKNLLNGDANIVTSFTSAGATALSGISGTGDTQAGTTVSLTTVTAATKANATLTFTAGTTTIDTNVSINGKQMTFLAGKTTAEITSELNKVSGQTGVTASVSDDGLTITLNSTAVGKNTKFTLSATGGDSTTAVAASAVSDGANAVIAGTAGGTAIDTTATGNAIVSGNTVTFTGTAAKGLTFNIEVGGSAASLKVEKNGSLAIQVGAEQNQQMSVSIASMSSSALGLTKLSVADTGSASNAITALDKAINQVSTQRASLGAVQNRLEHTVNSLQVTSENLSSAESRIRDVDMASEMANFTKNNILMQASQAMLAQANQSTQGILSLLR